MKNLERKKKKQKIKKTYKIIIYIGVGKELLWETLNG